MVGVRAGSDVGTPALGGTGTPIVGLYGTLTLNANGSYTYVANDNGVTANQVDTFVYTIRDGDGDLSTTTLAINVNNVTILATDTDALVNEAGLPNGTAAATNSEIDADGVIAPSGGTGPYTFTLNGSADGAYGTLVLNATTGAYTYTLDTAFTTSPAANNGPNLEDNRDSFSYTVTDANGNSTTGVINVDIIDDVPVIFYPDSAAALNGNSAAVTATLNLGNSIGADGLGSIVFDITEGQLAKDSNGINLTLGGQQLYLHGDGTGVLTATTSATTGGTLGYTVTINANGTYNFDVNGTISNSTETAFTNLTSGSAGNVDFRGIGTNDAATLVDILLSGRGNAGGTPGTVNTTSTQIGVDNQGIDANQAVRLDLVSNLTTSAGTPTGFAYTGHVTTTHFEQLVVQVQGNQNEVTSIVVNAILADNDQVFDNTPATLEDNDAPIGTPDETRATINVVTVNSFDGGSAVFNIGDAVIGTPIAGAEGITVTFLANGSVRIDGLQEGDQYEVDTTSDFNALIIEAPSSNVNAFDLGIFAIGRDGSAPIDQSFNIVATDADGDTVNSTIQTTIVPVAGSNTIGTRDRRRDQRQRRGGCACG